MKPAMQSSSLTDNVASEMSSWWPKSTGKEDEKSAAMSVTQSLAVVSTGSQPGSAPPSLPQSPSARRGVNLLDEVVSSLAALYVQFRGLVQAPGAVVIVRIDPISFLAGCCK